MFSVDLATFLRPAVTMASAGASADAAPLPPEAALSAASHTWPLHDEVTFSPEATPLPPELAALLCSGGACELDDAEPLPPLAATEWVSSERSLSSGDSPRSPSGCSTKCGTHPSTSKSTLTPSGRMDYGLRPGFHLNS